LQQDLERMAQLLPRVPFARDEQIDGTISFLKMLIFIIK
jgi:hypothetical protein